MAIFVRIDPDVSTMAPNWMLVNDAIADVFIEITDPFPFCVTLPDKCRVPRKNLLHVPTEGQWISFSSLKKIGNIYSGA